MWRYSGFQFFCNVERETRATVTKAWGGCSGSRPRGSEYRRGGWAKVAQVAEEITS